jgi:hypothetical protein
MRSHALALAPRACSGVTPGFGRRMICGELVFIIRDESERLAGVGFIRYFRVTHQFTDEALYNLRLGGDCNQSSTCYRFSSVEC